MQQTTSGNYRIGVDGVLLWTVVCALVPVLMAMASIAFYKEIRQQDPHATLIRDITLAALVCLPVLSLVLQWYALRRFAPRLSLWMWAGAGIVALVASLYLSLWVRGAEASFSVALMHWRASDAVSFGIFIGVVMTFAKVVGLAALVTLLTALAQIVLITFATKLPWKIILTAALAGAVAEATIAHLPDFLGIFRRDSLNGVSWDNRLVEFVLQASAGATFGVVSSLTVFGMLRPAEARSRNETRQLSLILAVATLTVICVPMAIAIIGRDGGRSAGLGVLKAFTQAPAQDISHGEPILRYSHSIETRPGKYPVVHYSPDNNYLVVLDRERRLMLVEVSTGRQVGQLSEMLPLHDRFALAWSLDSNAVVLRMKGVTDPVPGTRYRRNRAVIRKYSIPARELQSEYHTAFDECYESHATLSLIHAPDGNSVWTHCDSRSPPRPDSVMAIQLDAASLRPLRRKSYDGVSATNEVRTFGIHNGEVVYLERRRHGQGDEVRLGYLSAESPALTVEALTEPGLTGGLLSQGETIENGTIRAEYCGTPTVSKGADEKSVCRTLVVEVATGKLLRVSEDFDRRFEPNRQVISTADGLRIESLLSPATKQAEIQVIDEAAGNVRQRIETREQRPLAFSPDRRWLVMHSPGTKELRVYSIAR